MWKRKGQGTLEFTVLIIILIGALLAISPYFKRGIQGRWKASIDEMAAQYDPRVANTDIISRLVSNTDTMVYTVDALNAEGRQGYYTVREDQVNSVETKQGHSTIGSYYP